MKKQWVIKRIDTRVPDPNFISFPKYDEENPKYDYYYAGKHKRAKYEIEEKEPPIRDMFAAFNTVNAKKIIRYENHASAILALSEIRESGRYVIEPHFVIGE